MKEEKDPPQDGGLFVLNYWPGGGKGADEICVTATIFICGFVITIVIVGV